MDRDLLCAQAPEYYDEIQSHLQSSGMGMAGGGGGGGEPMGGPGKKDSGESDFWWDVGGFVLLGAALATALVVARISARTSS